MTGIDTSSTDFRLTVAGLALCLLIGLFSYHRHFSPVRGGGYRRVNWMVVGLAFVALGVMLLVHLVNLFGIETGRR